MNFNSKLVLTLKIIKKLEVHELKRFNVVTFQLGWKLDEAVFVGISITRTIFRLFKRLSLAVWSTSNRFLSQDIFQKPFQLISNPNIFLIKTEKCMTKCGHCDHMAPWRAWNRSRARSRLSWRLWYPFCLIGLFSTPLRISNNLSRATRSFLFRYFEAFSINVSLSSNVQYFELRRFSRSFSFINHNFEIY